MPIRVFVSHSTNIDKNEPVDMVHPDHSQFLRDLCEQLKAAKREQDGQPLFAVFADYDKFKVGDNWRRKLINRLGECGAGIVLLNKKHSTGLTGYTRRRVSCVGRPGGTNASASCPFI